MATAPEEFPLPPSSTNTWEEDAPPALDTQPAGWAQDEDAPRALAPDTDWASHVEPPSGLVLPDAQGFWSASGGIPHADSFEPDFWQEQGPTSSRHTDGEESPSAADDAPAGWGSGTAAPRVLGSAAEGVADEARAHGPASGMPVMAPTGWAAVDDAPRALQPEHDDGRRDGPAVTTSAEGGWGDEDVPAALDALPAGWAHGEDAPRAVEPGAGWVSPEEPPSGLEHPRPVAGWSAADSAPRVLGPEPRADQGRAGSLASRTDNMGAGTPSTPPGEDLGRASGESIRGVAPDAGWASGEELPSGLTFPDAVASWAEPDDSPRVLDPEQDAGPTGWASATSGGSAWGEETTTPSRDDVAEGWASPEDAPRALAPGSRWVLEEEPPSGLAGAAEPAEGWSATDDAPRVLALGQDAADADGSAVNAAEGGVWGSEESGPATGPPADGWASGQDAPRVLDTSRSTSTSTTSAVAELASAWAAEEEPPSGLALPAVVAGWAVTDDAPRALGNAAGEAGALGATSGAGGSWADEDAPSAVADLAVGWSSTDDAPRAVDMAPAHPDSRSVVGSVRAPADVPPSGPPAPAPAGSANPDGVLHLPTPAQRAPGSSGGPQAQGQAMPTVNLDVDATTGHAAAGTTRTAARGPRSTDNQSADADARGDPEAFASEHTPQGHPPSSRTSIVADSVPDKQDAEPEHQVVTPERGAGDGNGAHLAVGEEPQAPDDQGLLAALMDVAERALHDAEEAVNGAERAVARSSTRDEERLDAVMLEAQAHWVTAERHHSMAGEALADGLRSRLEHHASEVIRAAVDTQRAAGVATTAHALTEVLDQLKTPAERARQAEVREQLQAELDRLHAEEDRVLTAATRLDAASRELLRGAQWRAEIAVPALGWWPTLAADMAHAHQGRLWLDDTGTPRLLAKESVDGRGGSGRKVNAQRVRMLRDAGFLVTKTGGEGTSTLLQPSDMGREALYLATLYPQGLYADERAAYDARYEASRRGSMNNEDRKSAARRLPPLDPHTMRAVREKPVLLEDGQLPEISPESAAQHADSAELAQRLWRWAAMSHGRSDVTPTQDTDGAQRLTESPEEGGHDVDGAHAHAAVTPPGAMPPSDRSFAPATATTPTAPSSSTTDTPAPPLPPISTHDQHPMGWDDSPAQPPEKEQEAAAWEDEAPSALGDDTTGAPEGQATVPADTGTHRADGDAEPGPTAPLVTSERSAEPDLEARWRKRLAHNAAFGVETLGIDPAAGESFEGYAGRFDGDYDITMPSGRYCYRMPGFDRKKISVRYITDPTRDWESKQIKAVESMGEIMPVVRRHAARNADRRDPRTVELTEHEQRALNDVARGIVFRTSGNWYRHRPSGGTEGTFEWTTHALWNLSALKLITVPAEQPETGHRRHALLTEIGELRRAGLHNTPASNGVEADVQEQTALFAAPEPPTAPTVREGEAAREATDPVAGGTAAASIPPFTKGRHQALADIARGIISVADGAFILTHPWRPIRAASSQRIFRTVLGEGLAHETDGQVHLTARGANWFTRYELTPPAPVRSVQEVEQAPLPPIDYAPLHALPTPDDRQEGPRPPAPAPLDENWHMRHSARDEEAIEVALDLARDAAERRARSTARDVADLAAGPDHLVWTHQHPLAQFDENAAAALQNVTDQRTHAYVARAVLHLRAALVEAGEQATEHHVSNVRSPEWRTHMGKQADDVHRDRVRGITVSYLVKLRTHAQEHGLDADTVVHALEDAAGWTGDLRALGLKDVGYPHMPAVESVVEAAQYVANRLLAYAQGEEASVDPHAERRASWRRVAPRTLTDWTTPQAPEEPHERARELLAGDELQPGQGASAEEPPAAAREGNTPVPPAVAPTLLTTGAEAAPRDSEKPAPDLPMPDPAHSHSQGPEQPAGPHPDRTPKPVVPIAPVTRVATETRPAAAPAHGARPSAAEAVPAEARHLRAEKATAMPVDGPETTPADPGSVPSPEPPAAVREEDTVVTSTPPATTAADKPTAATQAGPEDQPPLGPAAAFADDAAYAVGHEALLAELAQNDRWLAQTPAAAQAAASLAQDNTLGPETLTALLALQQALTTTADQTPKTPHLAPRLAHHLTCSQLTMSKSLFSQAARTSTADGLRRLHRTAFEGGFITFREQTEAGELELGRYLQHRHQQLTPPPANTEETPATAEATPAMPAMPKETATVDPEPDDDIALPAFELPGDSIMSPEQAAPRLLAEAQARLAAGTTKVTPTPLAHIHGRPVYALVDAQGPTLWLGLTEVDTADSARLVSLRKDDLAIVPPMILMAAVTAWMNATDPGGRPLLDYAPSAGAPTPQAEMPTSMPRAGEEDTTEPEAPTAAIPGASSPTRDAADSQPTSAQPSPEPGERPQPSGPERSTASRPRPQLLTEATTSDAHQPPAPLVPQSAPPLIASDSVPAPEATADSTAEQPRGGAEQAKKTPRPQMEEAAPAETERVAELTALAQTALNTLGSSLQATVVLTAPRTAALTLESSGDAQRDREIRDKLHAALTQAIRQHPDRGLGAYRVDITPIQQVGQRALSTDDPAPKPAQAIRERLVAANNAAAAHFAERLRTDPNARLARNYLTQERHLPPQVQTEWGLGYAPSDRDAGRFDILVRELKTQGFTEDELLQAGLAMRTQRGNVIDYLHDRIVFPIHDEHGEIVGFSGRRIDRPGETKEQAEKRQSQKYFNTSNNATLFSKGELVFGLHHPAQKQALAASKGPRVSVEGYHDVIAVARAAATLPLDQRPVVGAPMGTAFTERQLTLLRGAGAEEPHPHIAFLDADPNGRKVLLDKWDLLLQTDGPTTVTTAPDAKDAAKLWEEGTKANGDGAGPVLRALQQHQPLLDAAVETVLAGRADETERAHHAFNSGTSLHRTRFVAAEAARYIREWVQTQHPGDTSALEHAALTWAKRLHQEWSIPGHITATAVLLGPGNHDPDYENEVDQHALDLLAADPEGYFANDVHVRSRQSASEDRTQEAPVQPNNPGLRSSDARRGQWPEGTTGGVPVSAANAAGPAPRALALNMLLPDPVDGQPITYTDRTTAAYALHIAVHDRLGQHTAETPEPDRLPQPLNLGTIHGLTLGTSGDDQTSQDPTVVVWLGPDRANSLRLSYSRFVEMTGPELLAAVEWRAAQAAGLLGTPLSQRWREAVRSILPPQYPAQPTPAQLADLLDTISQSPDAENDKIRDRAEKAVSLYTAGHPELALDHLATTGHIWVLKNDGSWIQEEAVDPELSWEELARGFSREASELADIAQAATALAPADPAPLPADLTVAHHSAHETLAILRPYAIGLPNTQYEKITDLVAQMDAGAPALRRLHGPDGQQLMTRAKTSFVRILEGLATVAAKIRLTGLSARLERTVARLRGQDSDDLPAPRAVRVDRRMQDLAHIERDLERRMAAPSTTFEERGQLQEQWIINRARHRARYEQLNGQPPGAEFLPDNGLVAGAPPIPNLTAAHELLRDHLAARVEELRDTDPHTKEMGNPYEPTADLFNGVAWAYHQRLVGAIPTGDDPQGPIPTAQLRQGALAVSSHQKASPLILRRTLNVTAERADRILHRLEEQQIVGPYRPDAPRNVLARPTDIDTLLTRPATPPSLRTPPAQPVSVHGTATPEPDSAGPKGADTNEIDEARISDVVHKILADRQQRSEPRGEPEPAPTAAPNSPIRKKRGSTAHTQAATNAIAAGQPTSLAPSQR